MAKKKVMMYIEEEVWLRIKESAFGLSTSDKRVSVGDYVTKMFQNGNPGKSTHIDKVPVGSIKVASGGDIKVIDENGKEMTKEEVKEITIPPEKSEQVYPENLQGALTSDEIESGARASEIDTRVIDTARKQINDKLGGAVGQTWRDLKQPISKSKQVGKK